MSFTGLSHSADALRSISRWPPKVSKRLQRDIIFQHKAVAMLAYLEDRLQVAPKMAQDANLTPTWSQLGPSWAQLGPILRPKMSISCRRGCIFKRFGDMRLKASKIA